MQTFKIGKNEAGQRLDKFLFKYLPNAPKNVIYKSLRKKNITVNHNKADGSEILVSNDIIETFFSDETFEKFKGDTPAFQNKEIAFPKEFKNIEILYEDENILFISKPVGVLCQKATISDISINEWLIDRCLRANELTTEGLKTFTPSAANRLDRNTSGILALGKTLSGLQALSEIYRNRSIEKHYLAVCDGKLDSDILVKGKLIRNQNSKISEIVHADVKKIDKSPLKSVDILKEDTYRPGNNKSNKRTPANNTAEENVITEIHSIRSNEKYSLCDVILHTGKTHQIRTTFSYLGHSLIGDSKYGKVAPDDKNSLKIHHQLLHSYTLKFPEKEVLPDILKKLENTTITAKPPAEFEKFIRDNGLQ